RDGGDAVEGSEGSCVHLGGRDVLEHPAGEDLLTAERLRCLLAAPIIESVVARGFEPNDLDVPWGEEVVSGAEAGEVVGPEPRPLEADRSHQGTTQRELRLRFVVRVNLNVLVCSVL